MKGLISNGIAIGWFWAAITSSAGDYQNSTTAADCIVTFNEIMYHPNGDDPALEWVELHNQISVDVDLSGWSLEGGVTFHFPQGLVLRAGGYLVVATDPARLEQETGFRGAQGPFAGRLANDGDLLVLRNLNGRLMDEIRYQDRAPWPVAADGSGASLAKWLPDSPSSPPANWTASWEVGGTPGRINFAEAVPVETPAWDTLLAPQSVARWHTPTAAEDAVDWRATEFDDSSWATGTNGFGFDQSGSLPVSWPQRFYPFEYSADDISGSAINGVLQGDTTYATNVPPARADSHASLHFGGVNGIVRCADANAKVSAYTLALWVRVETIRSCSLIALTSDQGPLSDWSHQLRLTADGRFEHYLYDGSYNAVTGVTVAQSGRWYYVAATAENNGVARLYVNGVEEGTAEPVDTLWGAGTAWVFGSNSGQTPNYFKGWIDDAAVWHQVLSPAHIAALASGVSPGALGGLTGAFVTDTSPWMWPDHSTAWFRFPFNVSATVGYAELALKLRYDDGFVAWLNGTEIVRRNAPHTPAWNATALAARTPSEAMTAESIDLTPFLSRLRSGRNVLAVQGLNVQADDPDFLIETDLSAKPGVQTARQTSLRFSELSPGAPAMFWCELINHSQEPVPLDPVMIRSSRNQVFRLGAGVLAPGEFLVIDAVKLGFEVSPGDRLFLLGANGREVWDAVRVTSRPQARQTTDPEGPFYFPASPTPGGSNRIELHDEIAINEILYHAPPVYSRPGTAPELATVLLVRFDSAWRYEQSGTDLGTAWREPAYNDSQWSSGAGLLGYRIGTLAEPIRTPLQLGQWTYYFRAPFVLGDNPGPSQIQLRALVDDGAVFYLNGQEIHRQRMPEGEVNYTTPGVNVGDTPLDGPWNLNVTNLVAGTNWLAIEVHQWNLASSDIVCGAELSINSVVKPGIPATPFREATEQWIELYNRSAGVVDLSHWQLAEAIEFQFPANTLLGPGEYLVVANDAATLRLKHGDVTVLGDFNGQLSRQSDHIVLLDANGNPADEVRYFDNQPWPGFADGGGSSLELRNPRADNSVAGAWAASNESRRSSWRHYSYTARARNPVFGPALNGFHELRLGLLNDGEVLLDNVSVVEDPNGTRRELVQNSTFTGSAAKWRLLGNHSHSRVVQDPDNATNQVLQLVATDARGYLHNQLETTLKSGANIVPVQAGRDYQISFDARWLAGSPQLHAELYYNRVAHTTILDVPEDLGTPGRRNSVYVENTGPTYTELRHEPLVPKPGQPIVISVRASDPDGVSALTLRYSINEGAWLEKPMTDNHQSWFSATLPAQSANGAVIQFYVVGRDSLGATSMAPAAGPESRALIRVDNRTPGAKRRGLHLILTARDGRWLDDFTNMMSDDRLGATVVWDNREVFYDCGVHLHGSMFSRRDPDSATYNIQFPADHLFRGVHRTVQAKRRVIQEIVAKHVQNQSGVPGMYEDIVELFSHRAGNAGAARLSMAHYNDVYLASQYEDGADGMLLNMEGIRVAMDTDTHTPEGIKLPFPVDWVSNYDITDLGDDPEQYRWTTMLRNNRARDDFSSYIAMAKAFSLSGAALQQKVPEVIDADEWMRVFALLSLFGIGDAYTQGNPHNLNFYVRPSDGLILAFPYDWDFIFANSSSAPLWGNQNLGKIINLPVYTRLFQGQLLDLMETTFNVAYLTPWIAHFGAVAGQSFSSMLASVRDRSAYVRSKLPARIPFEITTNGGTNFTVNTPAATLEGRGWIDVHDIRLLGLTNGLSLTWLDANRWRLNVPLAANTNILTFQALNRRGEVVGEDTITVTTTGAEDAQRKFLRVTELMYHPATLTAIERAAGFNDADEFEFVEVGNLGSKDVSLRGVRFTLGIQFDFTSSAIANLPAGARVLVVKNPVAFALRYGANLPVAGQYSGSLDNGGEVLRLVDQAGLTIQEFAYRDDGDWPLATDGGGPSLEVVDGDGDYNSPANWQASPSRNGSPGQTELIVPAFENILVQDQVVRLRFRTRAGQAYRVLVSDGLRTGDWQLLQSLSAEGASKLREVADPWRNESRQRFYRLASP